MADVKQLIIDGRIVRMIAAEHPEIIAEAKRSITPVLHELIMINAIHDYFCLSHQPSQNYTHKLYFIAVILRLFNPDALILDCKLRNGLRSALAQCLGDSNQATSYHISQTRTYIKIKAFSSTVQRIVGDITQQITGQNATNATH